MKRSLLLISLIFGLISPSAMISARSAPIPSLNGIQQGAAPAAQAPRQAAATVAAPAQQNTAGLITRKLANGLEVIVLEDHSVPLATVELAVRNGSYTEPPELNGLSHLYEHMFFKANRAVANREAYLQSIDQLGILYNGRTQEEIVEYFFNTTSPNLPVAMNLMRDAARYPLFDENEFAREKQVVIGELDRHDAEPGGFLEKEMNNRLFYKYPSRKNPGGNQATVATATTDMMRLIEHRYYIPNNSALVVTGDVHAEEVFRFANQFFGDWERGEDPFIKYPPVEHPPLPKSEGGIITQPVNNVIIEIGWQGPSIGKDNPSTYAADVFSFILTQPNSRFQRDLVDTGLVTSIGINYYTQQNVGPIRIVAETTPEKAHDAVRAIYNEIAHFNDKDYYTDEQLESAKGLLEAEDLYSREKVSEYTHVIAFWWASTGLDYFRGYLGNLRRTSRADISRYLTTYILGKPHVGLALLSSEAQQQVKLKSEELIGP